MQISCLEISIRYLKVLVKETTNIDNVPESIVIIPVSCSSDTKLCYC